jgi:hypothetical protein
MLRRLSRQLLVLLVVVCTNAFAAPTEYLISGTGSGSLAGTAFDSQAFTITLIGDPGPNQKVIDPLNSARVSIAGLGTTTLSMATVLGYFDGGIYNSEVVSGIYLTRKAGHQDFFDFLLPASSLTSLAAPIGPMASLNVYGLEQFKNVDSSMGLLTFNASSNIVFQAVAVPEPENFALMIAGLAVLGALTRGRKRSAS